MSKTGPKFDPQTRKRLRERFRREYFKARKRNWAVELRPDGTVPDYVNVLLDREATVFVNCIANLARGRADFSPDVPTHKERRANLRKIETHLVGLIDAILEADNAALGYAYLRGVEEVMRARGALGPEYKPLKDSTGYPGALDAEAWKGENAADLNAFALGIRHAIKELPEIDRADRSFDSYLAVQTARWLEDYLGRRWMSFTTF